MLQKIRKGSRSWLGIVMAVILIPPFAVVGVDYVFRGGFSRANPVIEVGDAEVSGREFENEYRRRVNQLQQQTKQSIDYATAKRIGLVAQIASGMVTRILYQQETVRLGIFVGDAVVRQDIFASRAFQGVGGKFDRQVFARVLNDFGLTEAGYIEARRGELASEYLFDTIRAATALPKGYVGRIYAFRNEKRVAAVLAIPDSAITGVPVPTGAQLAAYHKKNAKRYTAPEYRGVSAIVLQPKDVFERIKLDAAEVKREYDRRITEFTTPEKRTISQIVVPDEKIARQAHAALVGGRLFEAVARDVAKRKPLSVGPVSADEMPVPALRKAVFGLKNEGEVTEPVKTPLGWHIAQLVKIVPKQVTDFKDVRGKIEAELRTKRATPILVDLRNQIDDALGGGLKLGEIAERMKVKLHTAAAVDRQGNDPDGKAATSLPGRATIVARAFQQKADDYLEVVDFKTGGGFYVVQVDKVTPSALRPLPSIRVQVTKDWQAEETKTLAKKKAEELAKAVRGGQSLAAAAKGLGLTVRESKPLARYNKTGDDKVSTALRDALFKAEKSGAVVTAPIEEGYALARLQKIVKADIAKDKAGRDRIDAAMRKAYGDEMIVQYDGYLRGIFPIKIDQESIDKLFTGNQ